VLHQIRQWAPAAIRHEDGYLGEGGGQSSARPPRRAIPDARDEDVQDGGRVQEKDRGVDQLDADDGAISPRRSRWSASRTRNPWW